MRRAVVSIPVAVSFVIMAFVPAILADPGGSDAPSDPTSAPHVGKGTFMGDLGPDDDADWYLFDHGSYENVHVFLEVPDVEHVHLSLASPSGGEIADAHVAPVSADGGQVSAELVGAHESGTIAIGVRLMDPASATFEYSVTVDLAPWGECLDSAMDDLPDDHEGAPTIEGGFWGGLGCGGDVADWVRVDPPAGWQVRVQGWLEPNFFETGPVDATLQFRDDAGALLDERPLTSSGGGGPGGNEGTGPGGPDPNVYPGPVRIGAVLYFASPEMIPVRYTIDVQLVPPPDLAVVRLEVETVSQFQTDMQDVSDGMARWVRVEVQNWGESLAANVSISATATTVSDGVVRDLGTQNHHLHAFERHPFEFFWDAHGQIGDVRLEVVVQSPFDPNPDNDQMERMHYSVVGGTGRGYTYAPDYPWVCVGTAPEDAGPDDLGVCAGAAANGESIGAAAVATVFGEEVGAMGSVVAENSTQGAAVFVNAAGVAHGVAFVFLEDGSPHIVLCAASGGPPSSPEECDQLVCAGNEDPPITTDPEPCRTPD